MISDICEFKYSICSTYHVKYMYINKKKKTTEMETYFSIICDNQKWTNVIWLEFEIK